MIPREFVIIPEALGATAHKRSHTVNNSGIMIPQIRKTPSLKEILGDVQPLGHGHLLTHKGFLVTLHNEAVEKVSSRRFVLFGVVCNYPSRFANRFSTSLFANFLKSQNRTSTYSTASTSR